MSGLTVNVHVNGIAFFDELDQPVCGSAGPAAGSPSAGRFQTPQTALEGQQRGRQSPVAVQAEEVRHRHLLPQTGVHQVDVDAASVTAPDSAPLPLAVARGPSDAHRTR